MAILTDNEKQVEVSIIRHADDTKFKEYVKIGDREQDGAANCDRYIVSEPGCVYTVEITLKQGYMFGRAAGVSVQLFIDGNGHRIAYASFNKEECIERDGDALAEDVSKRIEVASVTPENISLKIAKARFQFRTLTPDENLDNETDVIGISPHDLGRVRIVVMRWMQGSARRLTPAEYQARRKADEKKMMARQVDRSMDIRRVDTMNYKKHGISTTTGFIGARQVAYHSSEFDCSDTIEKSITFDFHCRNIEFLEALSIVPYPPPLYCYRWEQLTEPERKIALKKLQDMHKDSLHDHPGHIIGGNHQRREWRSWNLMQPYERKQTYEKFQTAKKAFDRGDVKQQVMEKLQFCPQEIIDLDGNDSRQKLPATEASDPIATTATMQDRAPRPLRKVVKIKEEPIDVDAIKDQGSKFQAAPTIKHDSPDPETRSNRRVKFEDENEAVDLSPFETAEHVEPRQDGLGDDERRELELRNDELEKEMEAENERVRKELAELLKLTGTNLAE
ncbi:hypothetical protein VTL71DRAFT_15893 [Oculimacula yallundae]|uniref:DUF7918 domain-containing protein n=1 Tax=Oculimacula yallundae TaxID=86028 RepID=A0ABR4CDP7_9HELO